MSARDLKQDISCLSESECEDWLSKIIGLKPSSYRFRWESSESGAPGGSATSEPRHLGLIADEVPEQLLDSEGQAVDLYALSTALVASVKELNTKARQQDETIKQLRAELKRLAASR